ncbi:hypothetical protein RJZ56_002895 [Blastomyces dermatitidis]|uniref:PH domain-containing protein n=1 Tax=Ajellomyces dermatitidis (strain ER-3 / ATCC MYA-2586) TaxID=559297 RepID=A0ABP2F263_AJEDR|nr:PH domain-containing protein [Blastomyces dermatitidis ER-3]EEQ90856.1 PH domain-containing protein [Blastomyces dermatitidis ER-3]EQL36515.1 hypothetical protein BDFG_01905 [Blastomyces dermatitidis ATCC 26199]
MGSFNGYVTVYILGGVTFIPLILSLILLHAHLTFPKLSKHGKPDEDPRADSIRHPTDDQFSLKTGTDVLAEKFQRAHESDVAAGYFAVCREYVPGGVNGKPPERTTPAGEVVAAESPSVYQSMYRSIFDRKQAPTIDPAKGNGKNTRKARNVFYVILRHGHLMLYDDAEQIEVRYVISLAHHDVSIYNGGEQIPEGELWIKRNAICLTRKQGSIPDALESRSSTLPFYLFSENLSEKEDFYFAILKNLEKIPDSPHSPPTPQHYDVKHIVTLIQRLHSSEEHLQTRWINALMGRLFLAMYKTPDFESFIRKKITKKISRVTKPNFITKISLQKIDAGEGAPLITNPRLRDLTIDGDCCVEADINYSGNFRLEVAATARIELGTRFKPREVDLVLAVVLKSLKGHGLLRFKPPPSNRLWVSFESMPHMEMSIEPIVSSRQITYGVILRAIESRIREVVAESLVLPFWDDIPFLDTEHETFRGGIWHHPPTPPSKTVIPDETETQQQIHDLVSPLDAVSTKNDATITPPSPALTDQSSKSIPSNLGELGLSVSSGVDRINRLDPPRVIRSRTFSNVAGPVVTADTVEVDHSVWDSKLEEKDATTAMIEISNRSQPNSPAGTPVGSPPIESSSFHKRSATRRCSSISDETRPIDITPRTPSIPDRSSPATLSISSSPRSSSLSLKSETTKQNTTSGPQPSIDITSVKPPERQVIGSIGSAAAAARKWGLNVLKRNGEPSSRGDNRTPMPDHPIGRGRPLPPPGMPLPPPDRFGFLSNPSMPKRKQLPPPLLPERPQKASRPVPKPPLPSRGNLSIRGSQEQVLDELLIIEAPLGSEPTTPVTDLAPRNSNDNDNNTETMTANDTGSNLPPTEDKASVAATTESVGAESSMDSDPKPLEDDTQSTGTPSTKDETIAKPSSVPTPNEHTPDILFHS